MKKKIQIPATREVCADETRCREKCPNAVIQPSEIRAPPDPASQTHTPTGGHAPALTHPHAYKCHVVDFNSPRVYQIVTCWGNNHLGEVAVPLRELSLQFRSQISSQQGSSLRNQPLSAARTPSLGRSLRSAQQRRCVRPKQPFRRVSLRTATRAQQTPEPPTPRPARRMPHTYNSTPQCPSIDLNNSVGGLKCSHRKRREV